MARKDCGGGWHTHRNVALVNGGPTSAHGVQGRNTVLAKKASRVGCAGEASVSTGLCTSSDGLIIRTAYQ